MTMLLYTMLRVALKSNCAHGVTGCPSV